MKIVIVKENRIPEDEILMIERALKVYSRLPVL